MSHIVLGLDVAFRTQEAELAVLEFPQLDKRTQKHKNGS